MTSTSSHSAPDAHDAAQGPSSRQPPAAASSAAQLAAAKVKLKDSLRQYPDFPSPGILFEDISPLFADPPLHALLVDTLVGFISAEHGGPGRPDVIVGLDARGFYIAPSLALRFHAGFVPVRKRGKLPGETVEASYTKEYGDDVFQAQADAIKPGQKVLIVDDIIATGGTAAAAGELVQKLGGQLIGYVFMLELAFLKGRDRLKAPVYTLLSGQEGS